MFQHKNAREQILRRRRNHTEVVTKGRSERARSRAWRYHTIDPTPPMDFLGSSTPRADIIKLNEKVKDRMICRHEIA
jgi:hypothetical protein